MDPGVNPGGTPGQVYYVNNEEEVDPITKRNILEMVMQMASGLTDELASTEPTQDLVEELEGLQKTNIEIAEKMKKEMNLLSETLKKITIIHESNLELEKKFTRGVEILAKKKSRDEEFENKLASAEMMLMRCRKRFETLDEEIAMFRDEIKSIDSLTNLRLTHANNTLLYALIILAVAILSRMFF